MDIILSKTEEQQMIRLFLRSKGLSATNDTDIVLDGPRAKIINTILIADLPTKDTSENQTIQTIDTSTITDTVSEEVVEHIPIEEPTEDYTQNIGKKVKVYRNDSKGLLRTGKLTNENETGFTVRRKDSNVKDYLKNRHRYEVV